VSSIREPGEPLYLVRRSTRARRPRLTLDDRGETVVVLPAWAAEREAAALVMHHHDWIVRQRRRIAARQASLAGRPALSAGRPLLIGGTPRLVRATTPGERAALEAGLRQEARTLLAARVAELAARLQVAVKGMTVRDQRTRWGSASRRGTLSFNWRLILCPPEVLDYVVVHELAHLRVAGHSARFWRLVEKHHGDPSAARRWLREHQDEVRHALA
jgi:predicted metal-dependent hydrolase